MRIWLRLFRIGSRRAQFFLLSFLIVSYRLSVGGKLLTNLLKETLSFRQWDMMDETWLVGAVKERCCFVAPGGRGSRKFETKAIEEGRRKRPSDWDESDLREICK